MSEKVKVLKEFAEYAFDSLVRTSEGISEKEADWRPVEESNNVRWILNHLSRISNFSLQRIIKGDQNFTPEGWPEDYGEQILSVDKLIADINKGKQSVLDGLSNLTDLDLHKEIPMWGGTRQRKLGLFAYLGEIINHKGQVAMLRGNIKRKREKDSNFLL